MFYNYLVKSLGINYNVLKLWLAIETHYTWSLEHTDYLKISTLDQPIQIKLIPFITLLA